MVEGKWAYPAQVDGDIIMVIRDGVEIEQSREEHGDTHYKLDAAQD